MHQGGLNPYQPIVLDSVEGDEDLGCEVSFRMTYALSYHAESQYLLHWHPRRLLSGSLVMIAACCVGFWWSLPLGLIPFLVTLVFMMFVCALIYLALVRHAKSQIRKLQQDHGLVNGALCTVQLDDESLQLATPNGTYRWPSESAKVYRTGKGMLLCPEPLFFVFVPKQNDASREAFDLLRRRAESS